MNNIGNPNKMPKVNNQRISSTKYALKPITGEMFKVVDNFNTELNDHWKANIKCKSDTSTE